MNFALGAILIIILLLPGAVALKSYYTSVKEKESHIFVPFNELLLNGIILSFIIHTIAISILRLFNVYVKFNFLYSLIIGKDEKVFLFTDKEFSSNFFQFSKYMGVLLIIVFTIVKTTKYIIRINDLDLKFYILKNTNYWFNIFKARGLDSEKKDPDLIWVDALFENEVIYSGFLWDYNYSPQKDELENIVLRETVKTICNHTPDGANNDSMTSNPQKIPGDLFILPMSKMVNINVYYIKYNEILDNIKEQISND